MENSENCVTIDVYGRMQPAVFYLPVSVLFGSHVSLLNLSQLIGFLIHSTVEQLHII